MTASATRPATWRCCAPRSPRSRSSSSRRPHRSKRSSMSARGRYDRVALPRRHAAAELPAVRLVDLRRERIERGRFLAAAARRRARRDPRCRRAGTPLSEPPRLCAADLVPRLRLPLPMPELHRLAGRAPLYRAAVVPSLRPCRAGAGVLPGMPRGGCTGPLRARGRAPARGGERALSGRRARR